MNTENQVYDVDYFIKKFSDIPDEKWHVGSYVSDDANKCCALGHCGARFVNDETTESSALASLFPASQYVARINDGEARDYQQPTPKQRILAALHDIKSKQG